MRYVALPFQVYQLTRSTVAVGLIGLAEVIPLIVFSVLGGAIADSMDRRALIAGTQFGLIASSGTLAWLSFATDEPPLAAIYALTAVSGALSAIDRPARSAMVPSLVRPAQLSAAMALRQVVLQVTQIVGPALGGVLIAYFGGRALSGQTGVAWVYVIDALTCIAALVALRWVPAMAPAADDPNARTLRGHAAAVREGLAFAFRKSTILSIFLIDLSAMIFGMPRAVFPALAIDTFHIGAGGLGMLYAAPAVGALVGALTTGWVPRVRRQGLAIIIAVALWGVFIALAGLTLFSLALTLLLLALAGAADVVSAVFRGTMLLQETPDSLRGRVSALQIMVVTGGPRLGDVEAGLVAGVVGAPASIVVGGLACLVGTGAIAARFKAFRDYVAPAHDEERATRSEDLAEV